MDIQFLYLNEKVLKALCSGSLGILVFIGCQKAFDKVSCTKHAQKFKSVVFSGHCVTWQESLLLLCFCFLFLLCFFFKDKDNFEDHICLTSDFLITRKQVGSEILRKTPKLCDM